MEDAQFIQYLRFAYVGSQVLAIGIYYVIMMMVSLNSHVCFEPIADVLDSKEERPDSDQIRQSPVAHGA